MSSIKKNFIYNVFYQVLIIILPLVTAPYLSRVLGPDGLGEYSFTYSVANYFVLFAMLGVNNYGNRCVARARGDRRRLSSEFWSVYCFQALAAAAMACLYCAYGLILSGRPALSLLWLPYVLSAGLDVSWLFFGLEEFRLTVARNVCVKLATFALILFFVRGEHALQIYCALMAASFLASALALWPFVRRSVDFALPSLGSVASHLKPNLVLFVPVVAVSLYTVMDKVMLGWLSASYAENGYFENAYKIATMPTAVITALGTVMLPRVSNLISKGMRDEARRYLGDSMWVALALSFAFCFGVVGVAPVLVPVLFGEGFAPSELVMCVIVVDMPFMAWANVIRTQLLIPEGRDKDYVASVVAGAVVNIAVNLVLIPSFGALGAAFGTLFAEVAVCLVQSVAVRGEVPMAKWIGGSLSFLFVGAAMAVAVRTIGDVLGTSALTLMIQVVSGAALYAGLAWVWCVLTSDQHYRSVVAPTLRRISGKIGIRH